MKFLVPVSGSASSLVAVRYAAQAARKTDDEVLLVNVQPRLNSHAARFVTRSACAALRAERSEAAFSEARRLLRASGVRFESIAGTGRLADSIADIARRSRAHQIVLGVTRRAGWWQALFSQVPRILDRADIPVLVIGGERSGAFERYAVPACVGVGVTLLIAAE